MKRILILLFIFQIGILVAQEDEEIGLNIMIGKTLSTFGFVTSDGIKTNDIQYSAGNSLAIGVDVTLNKRHVLLPEVLYYEAGAKSESAGTPLSWKLNYLGLGIGYGFKVISTDRFSMIPGILFGADYMLKGEQMIGLNRFDVKAIDAFSDFNIRGNVFLNNRLKVSDLMSITLEYRFNVSINQIEKKDADISQKTRNLGHLFQLGINITL